MIHFERVTKQYSHDHEALKDVTFHLPKREMAFLTGHSGAGKSTLLKLLLLAERPSEGEIIVNNIPFKRVMRSQIPYIRRNMGVIFQNVKLLNEVTVYDNVALPLVIGGYRRREINRQVRSALDKVGLLDKEKMYPLTLSGGEQQRVGIARAIVGKPPLLLADEPTGNLDPGLSSEIMSLLEELNQMGMTMLIATHDLALIGRLKHRILTLHKGRMLSTGVRFTDDGKA